MHNLHRSCTVVIKRWNLVHTYSGAADLSVIDKLVQQCDTNHPVIHVRKTEEMLFDLKAVGDW